MKTLDKNMTWEIYADLMDLSNFFNIPYERIDEMYKSLRSVKKRPDEAMMALRRMLKEGAKWITNLKVAGWVDKNYFFIKKRQ